MDVHKAILLTDLTIRNMKIQDIKKEAEKYIEENNIERNTYQVTKAFIDGAKMVLKQVDKNDLLHGVSNWVAVSKPPKEHGYYWVSENGEMYEGFYTKLGWRSVAKESCKNALGVRFRVEIKPDHWLRVKPPCC